MLNQPTFEQFVVCFRKQFSFQTGRGGRAKSRYYTKDNHEARLKNSHWAIMAFIYCGKGYGFSEQEMLGELKITKKLYFLLEEELENVLSKNFEDKKLHKKLVNKIGLVQNSVHLHCLLRV